VLCEMVRSLQTAGQTVALCHGCFDVMHFGHLRHFEAARSFADSLIVTITQDRFVNKGPDRPIFPIERRLEMVAGLEVVDWVSENQWESAVETIRFIQPDLFVKGREYSSEHRQKNPTFLAEIHAVEEIGGRVAFTDELISSTSSIIDRLNDLEKHPS